MTTKLFITSTVFTDFDFSATYDEFVASTSAGSSLTTGLEDTAASANHVIMARSDKTQKLIWFYGPVDAVTISGTITTNLWMSENNMSANVQAAVRIQEMTSAGAVISEIVHDTNANHPLGVELPVTTRAAQNWTI